MTSKDVLLKLIMDKPVAYHADLAKAVGSVTAGLLLSQMLYWLGKGNDPEGWIYKSQADLYHETGLGRYEQETARKVLRKANVLQEERRGIPAKLYYKIDLDKLVQVLQSFYESDHEPATPVKSRMVDSSNLECGNPANNDAGFQQTRLIDSSIHTIAENTAQTTPENTNHHPISDHRSVPDRVSKEKDDDDAVLNPQSAVKKDPDKSRAERKMSEGPEPGERNTDHVPTGKQEGPNGSFKADGHELVAELVSKYREVVPPAKHGANDYAFIGRLYCDSGGYHDVDLGINELDYRVAAGLTPEKPLAYLRKIIESAPWNNETRREPTPRHGPQSGDSRYDYSAVLKQRLAEKEKKYADIYLS